MSLTDNPAAMKAVIKAFRAAATKYTMADLHQKPGEGNYDRIEQLQLEAAIRAGEAVYWMTATSRIDEQDTIIIEPIGEDEGG